MVGGTTIVLRAVGPQDIYLFGNPQITHFKAVYRRHTNFAKEYKKIVKSGGESINFGSTLEYLIASEGDLLGELFLSVKIKATSSSATSHTINHFGNSLLKSVEFQLGGMKIDKHISQWFQVYKELYSNVYEYDDRDKESDSTNGGKTTAFYTGAGTSQLPVESDRVEGDCALNFAAGTYTKQMYIPLRFFFNNHIGLALPLIALTRQEKKIIIELETSANLQGSSNISSMTLSSFELIGQFYILDTNEKVRFRDSAHEYLIETLKYQEETTHATNQTEKTYDLNDFKHPTKFITWVITNPGDAGSNAGRGPNYFVSMCNNSYRYDDGTEGTFQILLNGDIKNSRTDMSVYTRYNLKKYCKHTSAFMDRIGMYSFAINPLDYEPSGSCNFSKLNNKQIKILPYNRDYSITSEKIYIFAVTYNILSMNGGMGGKLYD